MIRHFDLVLHDGTALQCRAAGETGPRVLLLHGFPEAAFVWDAVMVMLAGQARCVAPTWSSTTWAAASAVKAPASPPPTRWST
ncbi:MAG: hypothetical protein WAQ05_09505, partial [Rubrivivax sp.]